MSDTTSTAVPEAVTMREIEPEDVKSVHGSALRHLAGPMTTTGFRAISRLSSSPKD